VPIGGSRHIPRDTAITSMGRHHRRVVSRIMVHYGTFLCPPWLRRLLNRVQHRAGAWPDYLRKGYRNAALPGGVEVMRALFQLYRVADPDQLGRILSSEYLIRQFEGAIRVDYDRRLLSPKKCVA
jgi:hypothetical protein